MRIRKIMPIESERVMSWPDNHTKYALIDGELIELSDSQRWAMCGDGICSKVSKAVIENRLPTGKYDVFNSFTGVNGSSLLLDEKRFNTIAFAEYDPDAKTQYRSGVLAYHYPNIPNLGDMTKVRPEDIGNFQLAITSPPCQSYSVAGKSMGLEDPRGGLFRHVVNILEHHKECQYLFFENVPGLLYDKEGATLDIMRSEFDRIGFDTDCELLDASDFGVPQKRLRLYMWGERR